MLEIFVIIDANFILLPFQFKIDYLTEIGNNFGGKINFLIYKQILDELEAKKRRKPNATKFLMNLKSGLLYLEKNKDKFNILYKDRVKSKEETTDDFLLRICQELKEKNLKVCLASNDADLRKKAKKEGVSTIFLRQKKYLSFD
jgi:rRNA-processing protein FCF1